MPITTEDFCKQGEKRRFLELCQLIKFFLPEDSQLIVVIQKTIRGIKKLKSVKINLPSSEEELLAEGIEVRDKKVFAVQDDQNHKFYPQSIAGKIRNILPNVLAEEVAEQLDLPSDVTATDNLKFKKSNFGWYQLLDCTATLIVEAESEEAIDGLKAWSKDAFF